MRRVTLPRRGSDRFNMTPMIDVIFLLIIFFICVQQYRKAEANEQVTLPDASSESVRSPDETHENRLIFNVLADGRLLAAGNEVSGAELHNMIAAKMKHGGGAQAARALEVWIRADRAAPYRVIEPVLLECSRAGVWKVAFKVNRPDPAPAATAR